MSFFPEKRAAKKPIALNTELSFGSVSLAQKAVFANNLSVMLTAGLLIHEALEITESYSRGKLKRVVKDIRASVEGGNSLADSMEKHPRVFPPMMIGIIRAGENSGTLPENLGHVAIQLQKEYDLKNTTKGALMYPMMILAASGMLALAMAYFVFPKLTPLFEGLDIELPATTRMVFWISRLVENSGTSLFIGILAVVFGSAWLFRQTFTKPVTHWLFLRIPFLKDVSRDSNLARFSLTLGTLLKSGIPIDESIAITSHTVPNFYYQRALERTVIRIKKGGSLALNLTEEKHLFPKLVTGMVNVGEQSGKLDKMLLYMAVFYENEVARATKTFATVLEPVLLIVIGVVVGTIALSIITPIYEITGSLGAAR